MAPAALLAGAYGFQYFAGLPPCEMCLWQRYPHFVAVALALAAALIAAAAARAWLIRLAAVAIAVSGLIGIYHAGVEQIGRALGRGRVCQDVLISLVAVSLKKKIQ